MTTVAEVIPPALDGERLDRVISLITGLSRADAAELVAGGAVTVDGACVTTKSFRLVEDAEVRVTWDDHASATRPEADASVDVTVVYEDPDVIVVDKQPGLVVHPGAGNDTGTLVHGLLARYPELREVGAPERPGIVHRLDKETSGLLMVARTQAAYEGLVAQLSARTVARRYEALVWGSFEVASGLIDAPIGRSGRMATRMTVSERGRPAVTRYRVRQTYHEPVEVAHIDCLLETGRTHQIRVHLQAIGHAVVGDERYHGVRESFPVPRLFLHAAELGFEHPVTGAVLDFRSPLPDDLREVLQRLG